MSIFARQFGRPRGLVGRLVGRGMARGNADFNRWFVHEISSFSSNDVRRVVELRPGPGIGLQETLRAFPGARVWGVDPSPEMLAQSRKRNVEHIRSGRLTLLEGDVASLEGLAPVDIVLAAHVLYFWHRPDADLTRLRLALRPGGMLALGYQLRQNMPPMAQRNFPKESHLLYNSDDESEGRLREDLIGRGTGFLQRTPRGTNRASSGHQLLTSFSSSTNVAASNRSAPANFSAASRAFSAR